MNRAEIGEQDKLVTLRLLGAPSSVCIWMRFPTEMTPRFRMSPHERTHTMGGCGSRTGRGKILIASTSSSTVVARKCISLVNAPTGLDLRGKHGAPHFQRAICDTMQLFPFSMELLRAELHWLMKKDKRTTRGEASIHGGGGPTNWCSDATTPCYRGS